MGAFSPRVEWPGCETDSSPPSGAALRICGVVPPLPHTSACTETILLYLTLFYVKRSPLSVSNLRLSRLFLAVINLYFEF
jgi:hypothetical protein